MSWGSLRLQGERQVGIPTKEVYMFKLKEPIHITLRKYRVAQMAVLTFLCGLTQEMWEWISVNAVVMNELQMTPIAGAFAASIAGIFATLKVMIERVDKDHEG